MTARPTIRRDPPAGAPLASAPLAGAPAAGAPLAGTPTAGAPAVGFLSWIGRLLARPRAGAVLAALTILAGLPYYLAGDINHDSAWFLDATARWLDGARLYVDVVETNPPLAFWLTAPVIWIARATGLFAPHVFVLCVFALIVASLALTRRLLAGAPDLPAALARGIVPAAALVFVAGPLRDFGQREHLATILALPYFVLLALRLRGAGREENTPGPGLAVLVGFAAALGLALKPYFLFAPALAELYFAIRGRNPRRLLRPESLTLAAAILAYAAAIPLLAPAYLDHLLPLGQAVFQAGYGAPPAVALYAGRYFLLALAAGLALRAMTRPALRLAGPFAAFADIFLIWALGFAAAYFVQMKGWSYHLYPLGAGIALAGAAMLAGALAAAAPDQKRRRRICAAWAALVVALPFAGVATDYARYGTFARAAAPLVRQHAAGGTIYVFSSNVSATYPLVTYAGIRSASRFQALWPLPGLVRRRAAGEAAGEEVSGLDRIEAYLRDAVAEDFTRNRPALVLIDDRARKSYFGALDFDYLDFFGREPRFAAIWANYAEIDRIGDFRVFVRR